MSEEEKVEATPAAEAKAEELGVDLSQVEPSGASGNVLVEDVKAAAEEGDAPLKPESNVGITDAEPHPQPTQPVTEMDPEGFVHGDVPENTQAHYEDLKAGNVEQMHDHGDK